MTFDRSFVSPLRSDLVVQFKIQSTCLIIHKIVECSVACFSIIAPPLALNLQPIESRVKKYIGFFFQSGTCRTSVNVLTIPSLITQYQKHLERLLQCWQHQRMLQTVHPFPTKPWVWDNPSCSYPSCGGPADPFFLSPYCPISVPNLSPSFSLEPIVNHLTCHGRNLYSPLYTPNRGPPYFLFTIKPTEWPLIDVAGRSGKKNRILNWESPLYQMRYKGAWKRGTSNR